MATLPLMLPPAARRRLRLPLALALAVTALLLTASVALAQVANTGQPTQVAPTSATLHGTINSGGQPGSYRFEYGTDTSYAGHTDIKSFPGSAQPIPEQVTVTGLQPSTTYHVRIVTLQGSGATATASAGNDVTFTTPAPDPTGASGVPGVAVTRPATDVKNSTATLNGLVDPQGIDSVYAFAYGPTTNYGSYTPITALQGNGPVPVSAPISGLERGTTYHFRVVVLQGSYPDQTASTGADFTFTTATAGGTGGSAGKGGRSSLVNGIATLIAKSFPVRRGLAAIPFRCAGAAGAICTARATVTVRGAMQTVTGRGRARKVRRGPTRTFTCFATRPFSFRAPASRTIRPVLSGQCAALLRQARRHRLPATLTVAFTSHQVALRTPVTLVG